MTSLDSRSLRYLDCFGQKFSVVGKVYYRLTTAAGASLPVEKGEGAFTINVVAGKPGQTGKQHNVTVRREGQRLVADPPHLEIAAGDIVLWHCPEASTPGYSIRGEGPGGGFRSIALTSEAVYTHAFGTPGHYRWIDANGSKVSGAVKVRSLDPMNKGQSEKWLAALNKGTLVLITGDKASPAQVEILTGQTVFWAIEKAPGITITDERLVKREPQKEQQAEQQKAQQTARQNGPARGRGRQRA